ncbi:hypothetical protein OAQ71_00095 [bacterium]|nr:hypothetical protein [bacterium]
MFPAALQVSINGGNFVPPLAFEEAATLLCSESAAESDLERTVQVHRQIFADGGASTGRRVRSSQDRPSSDFQNLERPSVKGVASKLCQGPVVRSLELVISWTMSLGLLGGCNLANYEGQQVEVVVDVVEISETLRAERAELSQGADGLFRPLVHQEFDVELESVKRRKVRRDVHDTGPVDWILSEAFLDPILALFAILDFLPQVDESESSNNFRSLPGWPLSGVAAVLPGITHAPYPTETRVVKSVSEIERRPAGAKDRSVLVDEGLRVFVGDQLANAKGGGGEPS